MLPRSLQARLVAIVFGLVAAVWVATATMVWFDASHELDELLDGHLAQAAALLVVQQASDVGSDHSREIDAEHGLEAPTLHKYATKVAFQVFHEGRLAMRSANAPSEPILDPAHFRPGFQTVALDGTPWRVLAAHGRESDVQVYVAERLKSRMSILWALLRSTLWPMALALPLLALGTWWAVRRGIAPLRELGRTVGQREPSTLEPLPLAGLAPELAPMVAALNGLFERIAQLLETERRFTSDAAHELRTPIAAIRAQAQVARGEHDDAMRRHALDGVLEGCDRATRVVEQLLTLSRLESGARPVLGHVDVSAVARRMVVELAPLAVAKDQAIALEAAGPCIAQGDETLWGVLVRNLVDNAIRYGPPAAAIRVRVACETGRVQFTVEDGGPGMSEADAARLGERFFRVLGAGENGSGLGWSIVRRIAEVHGLELQVDRSPDLGGLRVRVEGGLPAAARLLDPAHPVDHRDVGA